jgi:hypothetical protein
MRSLNNVLLIAACVVCATACESRKETTKAIEAIASANPAIAAPSVAPVVSVPPTPPKKVIRRPSEHEVVVLTPEHRALIENRHPEAAGFVGDEQLEERLFALELRRGKDREATEALDRMAKGKWMFVSGPIVNPQSDGFELAIAYTPRDPADPIGLTSQWINIKFTDIQGFDATQYRVGEQMAVLAKYNGRRAASPGFDLILLEEWYPKSAQ